MISALKRIKEELRRRWHVSISEQGTWLRQVVQGYFNYYAVPSNYASLAAFQRQVIGLWYKALRRRSQRDRTNWSRINRLATRWLPPAKITHPWPDERFDVRTRGKSPVR